MEANIHGGNVYQEGKDPEAWLDFSANINPLGIPQEIQCSLKENFLRVQHYPEPEGTHLKKALAEFYQIHRENIVLGNGAVELLYLFFHCIHPEKVLLPVPSFSEYERAARAAGAEIQYLFLKAEQNFQIPWPDLFQRLSRIDVLVLGNPNNPTGNLYSAEEIEACVAAAAKQGIYVVIDESFLDFRSDQRDYTVRHLVGKYENLWVLQSLTKFYAIPGLRLGFGIFPTELASVLEKGKDPWNVNVLAQNAGLAALSATAFQEASRHLIAREGMRFAEELSRIPGFHPWVPTVNFIFSRFLHRGISGTDLVQKCKEKGILIRNCRHYPGLTGDCWLRMAVRTPAENQQLLDILKVLMKEEF